MNFGKTDKLPNFSQCKKEKTYLKRNRLKHKVYVDISYMN